MYDIRNSVKLSKVHYCVVVVAVYPQLNGRIKEDWFDVNGLAIAVNKIFVVCRSSALVRVFDAQMPHAQLYEMFVSGLVSPADLAVCRDTVQLYVADDGRHSQCVWKLDPRVPDPSPTGSRCKAAVFIQTNYGPYSLSLTESTRHLVVTPESSVKAFFVYDADDGRLIRRVDLRSDFALLHVVEVPTGQDDSPSSSSAFIASHTFWLEHRGQHYRYHMISELNSNGEVIVSFDGRNCDDVEIKRTRRRRGRHLMWPLHVAVVSRAGGDGVLVADKGNEQVMFLNLPHLGHLGRVLISRKIDGVRREIRRLCYEPSTEQLVIGFDDDGIGIYTWS